ncbi:uncharacterized protein [Rutidosis leptorrhynchoides]|uniref:uncharacterized protein n=1 Tax=Rutidosis leptorrhynchoides TaxID=125765 RepID=UPI003A994229
MNCEFIERREKWFNNFINNSRLVEVPLVGKKYTRICVNGIKLSKLDRFLVSEKFCQMYRDISVTALEKNISDHCPIILRDKFIDFGPKPIKVFDEWIETAGWRKDNIFIIKLRNVKFTLKQWSSKQFGKIDSELHEFREIATKWECEAENRSLGVSERSEWMEARKKWLDREKIKSSMAKQKSRKHRGLNIKGVWNEDPAAIKDEVFNHFKSFFSKRVTNDLKIPAADQQFTSRKITESQAARLEEEFLKKEVLEAINECSSSKAPGPDGYNFKFFKVFWDLIKCDLISA